MMNTVATKRDHIVTQHSLGLQKRNQSDFSTNKLRVAAVKGAGEHEPCRKQPYVVDPVKDE